jgi:hypothetical protein
MAKSRKRQDDTLSPEYASSGNDPNNVSGHGSDGNGDGHAGGGLGDRVAARAYELYLARGGGDGQAWDDWLAAERELSSPPGDSGN